jgi:hypothetical protein
MASHPLTSEIANPPAVAQDSPTRPHHRMSTRNRLLFFVTAWLIVLMPFLFWWSTWFGRQLSDKQITEYLNDDKHPRHIQHALVQLGERMARHDAGATPWYPQLPRLASHNVEEVRNTDAWVMGQDTSGVGFHEALLKMLGDSSAVVRGNAALSLVRFGDASGRPQIVALLQPVKIVAPFGGHVTDIDKIGAAIRQGGLIAKFSYGHEQTMDVRSPITGRIHSISAPPGVVVTAGTELVTVDPSSEQVWEALRALYLVGQLGDLPAIRIYERNIPEIPDRLREQALLTEKAIQDRATHQP